MKIDEVQILNYVEHKLDANTRTAFEKLTESDTALQRQVQALKASQLPYEAAFAVESMPTIPEHLQTQVEQLTRVSINSAETAKQTSPAQRWLVVACLCFAFIAGSVLTLSVNSFRSNLGHKLIAYGDQQLIDAMIQYQALYSRATVEPVKQSQQDADKLIQTFNQAGAYQLSIPDFNRQGYVFRRAQELAFNEQIIIQMVYLPDQGKPLAVCVTQTSLPDQNIKHYEHAGINSVLWVKQGLSYMLMGDYSRQELESLHNAISI